VLAEGEHRDLPAVFQVEFRQDVREVTLDRVLGERERRRDLPVALPVRDQGDDLLCAWA
jgi:hypothetical protein